MRVESIDEGHGDDRKDARHLIEGLCGLQCLHRSIWKGHIAVLGLTLVAGTIQNLSRRDSNGQRTKEVESGCEGVTRSRRKCLPFVKGRSTAFGREALCRRRGYAGICGKYDIGEGSVVSCRIVRHQDLSPTV